MNKIRVMDEDLANKIAAGEVIERCMNVVKELVENSIDAGSHDIKIELQDSGVKEIRVTDDGIGMDRTDALLAFSRHATSKLSSLDDLFHIHSLGFRGEALPSIASVSKVSLKTSDGEVGTLIEIYGGHVESVNSSDIRKGTMITVSELFYNTPVRLKYLRNLYVELSYIVDYVNKMALSYPDIRFTLTNNDKVLLKTDGSERLLKVIHDIYGLDVSKKMVEVYGENDDYVICGYMSYPEMAKSNRNSITLLVNGRVIRNNDLIRMIRESYHTYIPADKFPILVLQIEVDPILVDVNIHPSKMDVKFSKMDSLKELLMKTLSEKLEQMTWIPHVATRNAEDVSSTPIASPTIFSDLFMDEKKDETSVKEYPKVSSMTFDFEVHESDAEDTSKKTDASFVAPRIKKMHPVGLVHGTYIVAENEDGMFLIDQHAANERINYEKYLHEMGEDRIGVTDLFVPISLEFPSNDYIILKQHFDLLEKLHFTFEEFGSNTIIVRSHPIWLPKNKEEEAIRKIFDIIISKEEFSQEKFNEKAATMLACKMSIKANDHISLEEMEALLDRLRRCNNPFTCPHGRPTIITYSKYELEKLFKRAMS